MKPKCDKCDKAATIHLTEIVDGEKLEKHLCEDCASSEGITVKANVPISQLLEDFILQSSKKDSAPEIRCEVCGTSFEDFRTKGVLGCPHDYDAFRAVLDPLLERTQEGASQHVGKAPQRAGENIQRQNSLLRLRARLKAAVTDEDYEAAAKLRDKIKELEQG